jgi:hypothetical protein
MAPEEQSLADYSLKAKRIAIKKYVREDHLHHCFRRHDGQVYEGYIAGIKKETITFCWAFSPLNPEVDLNDFEIPIIEIEALI